MTAALPASAHADPAHDERAAVAGPVATALAGTVAVVAGVVVVALLLFYALEVQATRPHLFGPLSDIGTACWDLLAAPLFWGVGRVLFRGAAVPAVVSAIVVVLSFAGAAGSALLVIGALSFEISTSLSVLVILAQCVWLYLAGRRMARTGGWGRGIARLGQTAALAQAAGVVLSAVSLLLGWGSPAQVVVMIVGVVPGILGWAAWPVWFALLARELRRPLDQVAAGVGSTGR